MNLPPEDDSARGLRHVAEYHSLAARASERAARAKSAADWFDIFTDIVEQGVRQGLEMNGQSDKVLETLQEHRPTWRKVRDAFSAQGLELNEGIDVEGPTIALNSLGIPEIVAWPMGPVARFFWTDGSTLEFTGRSALVAVSFVMWWTGFNQVHVTEFGGAAQSERRRIIDPTSTEYQRYVREKQADQEREDL
jgi:hypothetical protein